MFFEEDKDLDNLDDLELDFGEFEDKSITWDELIEDEDADLVSVKKADAKKGLAPEEIVDSEEEIVFEEDDLNDDAPAQDAFEVFGGDKEELDLDSDDDLLQELDDEDTVANSSMQPYEDDDSDLAAEEEDSEVTPQRGEFDPKEEVDSDDGVFSFSRREPSPRPNNNKSAILGAVVAVFLVLTVGIFWFLNSQKGLNNTDLTVKGGHMVDQKLYVDVNANTAETDTFSPDATTAGTPTNAAQNENNITVADTGKSRAFDEASKNFDNKNEKKVVLGVADAGRSNPFVPAGNINLAGFVTNPPIDIIMPPEEFGDSAEVQKLMGITVTGILYDSVKPSAIINVGGSDYFVQKGDKVDSYLVTQITPTNVTISSGKNTYKAGVGQPFDNRRVGGQIVVTRNAKFGGQTRQYTSSDEVEVTARDNDRY